MAGYCIAHENHDKMLQVHDLAQAYNTLFESGYGDSFRMPELVNELYDLICDIKNDYDYIEGHINHIEWRKFIDNKNKERQRIAS